MEQVGLLLNHLWTWQQDTESNLHCAFPSKWRSGLRWTKPPDLRVHNQPGKGVSACGRGLVPLVALDLMLCIVWTRGEAKDEGLHQVPLLILTIIIISTIRSPPGDPIPSIHPIPSHTAPQCFIWFIVIVASMSGHRQRLEVVSAGALPLKLSPAFSCAVKTKPRMG